MSICGIYFTGYTLSTANKCAIISQISFLANNIVGNNILIIGWITRRIYSVQHLVFSITQEAGTEASLRLQGVGAFFLKRFLYVTITNHLIGFFSYSSKTLMTDRSDNGKCRGGYGLRSSWTLRFSLFLFFIYGWTKHMMSTSVIWNHWVGLSIVLAYIQSWILEYGWYIASSV
jgi:hypothetical protein